MNPRSVLRFNSDRQWQAKQPYQSTEVRHESIHVEVKSRKRAADTAIEHIDPRMEMEKQLRTM